MTDQRAPVADGRTLRRRCQSSIAPTASRASKKGTRTGINPAARDRAAEETSSRNDSGGPSNTTLAKGLTAALLTCTVAAIFAILLGFIPMFGALVRSIPVSVQGGIEMYLFGLIAVIGGKIWVDARVDFSKRANLAVAAIPLIIAAGIPATQAIPIHLGGLTLTFNNLGLGALSAIVLYQLLRPGHIRDVEREPAEVVARE